MVEGQEFYRESFPWLGFVFGVGVFSWFGIQAWTRLLAERERQQTLRTYALGGSENRNVEPAPCLLSTVTVPPWASVNVFTMASPSPVPPASLLRPRSTR